MNKSKSNIRFISIIGKNIYLRTENEKEFLSFLFQRYKGNILVVGLCNTYVEPCEAEKILFQLEKEGKILPVRSKDYLHHLTSRKQFYKLINQ